MPEEINCPFMSGAGLLIQDITKIVMDPRQATVLNGSGMNIKAEIRPYSVPCMREKCALWVERQNPVTKMIFSSCAFRSKLPFDEIYS
jgi:hypothetical protein